MPVLSRLRRSATVLVAAASILALAACGGASHAATGPAAPGDSIGQPLDDPVAAAIRDLPLTTQSGAHITLGSFAGKVVVISDVMTLCQETCPMDTATIVEAARAAEAAGQGDHIEFLSITVDPQRDTLRQLAAYRSLFRPPPADWETVTGSPATLTALWKYLGIYIQRVPDTPPYPRNWLTNAKLTYDIDHSDEVYFLDGQGRERFLLEGAPHINSRSEIPQTLYTFLDKEGRDNLTQADAQAWTLPQSLQVLSWLDGRTIPPAPN